MDMKYTYEELWKAYQRLQAENTALKQEIQQLKGLNIGECKELNKLFQKEFTQVCLSLEEKVALFRSLFRGREDVFAR